MKRKSMSQGEPNLNGKVKKENSEKPNNFSIGHFFQSKSKLPEVNKPTCENKNFKTIEEEVKAKRVQAEQAVMNRNIFEQPKKQYVPKTVMKENFSSIIFPLFIKCQVGGMKEKINTEYRYTQVKQANKEYKSNDCITIEHLNNKIG
jgi:hypothetical protein